MYGTTRKKNFYLYFNVFDKIVESGYGLKNYENCDNHFFYVMTNFYKDEPDKFTP
jgi:hypothetical protein